MRRILQSVQGLTHGSDGPFLLARRISSQLNMLISSDPLCDRDEADLPSRRKSPAWPNVQLRPEGSQGEPRELGAMLSRNWLIGSALPLSAQAVSDRAGSCKPFQPPYLL